MGRASEEQWGRAPGARPPLAPVGPLAGWAFSAVVLVVVVLGVVKGPGPLDDPRQGAQRTGLLIDADDARDVHALGLPGSPVGRRAVVVIFDRQAPSAHELLAFAAAVPDSAAVVLVLAQGQTAAVAGVRAMTDARGRVAAQLGMPRPRDGGPPIGYAVIDADGRVRYATLDPTYPQHGFEVQIVTGAVA